MRLDLTVALLSLLVVPFLYLCLRYYMNTIVARNERVKELESRLIAQLYEVFSAIRLVKSYAREPFETTRYTDFGKDVMQARIAITWQESLFSVCVTVITLLGTIGILSFLCGLGGLSYLGVYWVLAQCFPDWKWQPLHQRPAVIYSMGALLFGGQLLSMGFLAELFTAYYGRHSEGYSIKAWSPPRNSSSSQGAEPLKDPQP